MVDFGELFVGDLKVISVFGSVILNFWVVDRLKGEVFIGSVLVVFVDNYFIGVC